MVVVYDTLSFCHPELGGGVLGWLVGALAFVPWVAVPSLFLDTSHSASSEIVYRLWLLYVKVFAVLVTALQHVLAQPVPYPEHCVDPFGTTLGMPALGTGVLGVYASLTLLLYRAPWRPAPSFSLLATLGVVLVAVPAALVADGLHTVGQVAAGLGLGLAFGAVAGTLTHTVLAPLLVPVVLADPQGLGLFLGTQDTYLQRPSV